MTPIDAALERIGALIYPLFPHCKGSVKEGRFLLTMREIAEILMELEISGGLDALDAPTDEDLLQLFRNSGNSDLAILSELRRKQRYYSEKLQKITEALKQ